MFIKVSNTDYFKIFRYKIRYEQNHNPDLNNLDSQNARLVRNIDDPDELDIFARNIDSDEEETTIQQSECDIYFMESRVDGKVKFLLNFY
jgi:hypothetical protein